ncbi:hypothetical protein BT69DRAFT_1281223 [Atractiella rhizophila]|nr:hypothetical protein BT69DRAFT_1281223 [Atractiella rhizophila]
MVTSHQGAESVEMAQVAQHADALQSGVSSLGRIEKETLVSQKDDQGTESIALVHLITPVMLRHGIPIHLSILPSFLGRIPPSVHTLRITFVLPIRLWKIDNGPSKLTYFSPEILKNVVESDGALNLCITLEEKSTTVTFGDGTTHHTSMDSDSLSVKPFTCTFHLPDNRSKLIFEPVARYSQEEQGFVPVSEWNSTIPSTRLGTTIQLTSSPTRIPGVLPCSIAQLPTEILSLVLDFLSFGNYEYSIKGVSDEHLVSFIRVSAVCQLWKVISVPFLNGDVSVKERHSRLKVFPDAGRLWEVLRFETRWDDGISIEMATNIITGSPNVSLVTTDAFWNEEEAKIVLHAIEGLRRLDYVNFGGRGLRRWKREEVESFMRRTGHRITSFCAFDVEDSIPSASPDLQLSSALKRLALQAYPPLPSLSFPQTLTLLRLSDMCPLPPSVSGSCLPPLLEHLDIALAPYSPDGKISVLLTPLDLSHLEHLTHLELDGGHDTSNLVFPQFFHTLRNAIGISYIDVRYCVVDWEFIGVVFSDFIRWFFGDRGKIEVWDTLEEAERSRRDRYLKVQPFFGEWLEEEICEASSTLREFGVSGEDEHRWVREGGAE